MEQLRGASSEPASVYTPNNGFLWLACVPVCGWAPGDGSIIQGTF